MTELVSQMISGFPGWIAVGWIVSLAAVGVAIQAYRRTHLPIVKVRRVYGEFLVMPDTPLNDRFIRVDLVCVGAEIFGLSTVLEVFIDRDIWNLKNDLRTRGYELERPEDATFAWTYQAPFCCVKGGESATSEAKTLNPVKKGQYLTFELRRGFIQEAYDTQPLPRVSSLPAAQVAIVIYANDGHRELKRIPSKKFQALLERFDEACHESTT